MPHRAHAAIDVLIRRACCLCLLAALTTAPSVVRAGEPMECHIGSYRLADGSTIDIAPDDPGALRWRRLDGSTGALRATPGGVWKSTAGWTDRPDGITVSFSSCSDDRIDFSGVAGKRIPFDVTNVTFVSHGIPLRGRLVMPKGEGRVPVVVQVHGADTDPALVSFFLQRMLPAEGIGTFVYDKRGTGESGGRYTQDYSLLADDAVAAVAETRRLAGGRLGRIGFQGGSQAGWVAPLAADRTGVDFVIVCYGLAVNVIDEDQEAVELQMREKGYSPQVIAHALQVAGAVENVFASGFTRGFRRLDALRAKYRTAPWYKDVHGDWAFFFLPHSDAELRAMAPQYDWHVPFHYDPMPTLRADTTPQLWILGGEDYEAPSAVTSERIKGLIALGRPFTLAYYAKAEHGMTLFDTKADGTRVSTRYAPGYFALIRDFAEFGHLRDAYGDAVITVPPGRRRPGS